MGVANGTLGGGAVAGAKVGVARKVAVGRAVGKASVGEGEGVTLASGLAEQAANDNASTTNNAGEYRGNLNLIGLKRLY